MPAPHLPGLANRFTPWWRREDAVISLEGLSADQRSRVTRFLLAARTNLALASFFIARGIERFVPANIEVYSPPARRDEPSLVGPACCFASILDRVLPCKKI